MRVVDEATEELRNDEPKWEEEEDDEEGGPKEKPVASPFSSILSRPTPAPLPPKTLALFSGVGGWW